MDVARRFDSGDFDPGNEPKTVPVGGGLRFRHAGGGVVIRDADDGQAEARSARDERGRRQPAIRGGRVQVKIDHGSHGRLRARPAPRAAAAALPFDKRSVLADQQLEVCPLFVGELEEDLLALRVLEALAVALEEPVRAALAPDADHQRLQIVDALGQLLGAGGEQAVGGALEEQERRPRLELRILLAAAAR